MMKSTMMIRLVLVCAIVAPFGAVPAGSWTVIVASLWMDSRASARSPSSTSTSARSPSSSRPQAKVRSTFSAAGVGATSKVTVA